MFFVETLNVEARYLSKDLPEYLALDRNAVEQIRSGYHEVWNGLISGNQSFRNLVCCILNCLAI